MGMTEKYFGQQDPELHGGPVTWPGTLDGFPILGRFNGDLKQEEYEDLTNVAQFRCETFRTWDPESMERLAKVMDHAANGQFFVQRRLEHYDEQEKGWRIYLEWVQVYGLAPRGRDAVRLLAQGRDGP